MSLGTLRSAIADYLWLRTNIEWERRNEPGFRRMAQATLIAAPNSVFFRLNVARMVAYDLPAWRAAREPYAPAEARRIWRLAGARAALRILADAPSPDAALAVEAATIALYGSGDRELAARLFRRTAELPGAPWHAGRIHAELLVALGRREEALQWLRKWSRRLPADDPAAQRELVLERIAAMEAR